MPPHLQLTLLNVPPAMDATASLPRPQHVILNHLYIQRSSQNANALVVGTTHRSVLPSTAQRAPACRCFRPPRHLAAVCKPSQGDLAMRVCGLS